MADTKLKTFRITEAEQGRLTRVADALELKEGQALRLGLVALSALLEGGKWGEMKDGRRLLTLEGDRPGSSITLFERRDGTFGLGASTEAGEWAD